MKKQWADLEEHVHEDGQVETVVHIGIGRAGSSLREVSNALRSLADEMDRHMLRTFPSREARSVWSG